ncbi:MAG TPA: histidine kinase, partial [Caldithrix sp.]|nr:histidine kinase [Caldithrix sp.]
MSLVKRYLIKDALFLIVIFCISSLTLPSRVLAIKPTIYFYHLNIADGLSQSSVTAILQDRFGFMWFGTQNGLNRYDGYHFRIYKNIPFKSGVLSDNWIQCLTEDKDGFIWVGTHSGGLFQFDQTTEKFIQYRHNPEDPHSLSHN